MTSRREDCTDRGLHGEKFIQKEYYMERRQKKLYGEGKKYTNGDETHRDGTYGEETIRKSDYTERKEGIYIAKSLHRKGTK